ncbi:MAG: DUF3644 domain-containing protein [Nitrospirota bacterium]
MRLSGEIRDHLVKARDSALLAVETYNRPTAVFRSGAYIVLMNIAWTSLFHAVFFKKRLKPYYKKSGSNRYIKVDGEFKCWELNECLKQYYKDQNPPVRKNLDFFIGLRNKIEHRSMPELDPEIFGECQAMLMNFENLLCQEFGDRHALKTGLTFSLQLATSPHMNQLKAMRASSKQLAKNVKGYIERFRTSLSDDVQGNMEYSFKVFLIPKIHSHSKSSDLAVEFIPYDKLKPEEMDQYSRLIALIKPKEVTIANLGGYKPSDVAKKVEAAIGKPFKTSSHHVKCYKLFNARPASTSSNPEACDNRYCYYDAVHKDYVYKEAWVSFLIEKLSDEAEYNGLFKRGIES